MTFSINGTQHSNTLQYVESHYADCYILFIVMPNVIMMSGYAEYRYAEGHYAE